MFTSDLINTSDGILIATKLQVTEKEEEEDENNEGFKKLIEEGHPSGIFIMRIRERFTGIFEKQKVRKLFDTSLITMIDYNRLQWS